MNPTTDVLEFLRFVRKAIGEHKPITIGLLDVQADGTCRNATADEHDQWRRSIASLDDAHMWLETAFCLWKR